jgi:hypothetical protein
MAVPSARELREEEQLLNEPLYQQRRPRMLEFVVRLQQAKSTEDWVYLHRDLLIEFGARQQAAEEALPEAKSKIANEMRELARQDPKPIAELTQRQETLERIKRQELVAKASQHALRQIGDGIAWRALRYDRRAVTVLGQGERVGRLASGVGLDAELAELSRLWEEEGIFAVHNDLTNCLRHGDLTVLRPQKDGTMDVTLVEVKAGQRLEDTPQMERLKKATDLLREGRSLNEGGEVVHVTIVPSRYETFLALLPGLIARARREGHAWVRPHECLLVGTVDYTVWGGRVEEMSARSQEERKEVGWPPEEPDTLDWLAALRRMRDRSWSFSSLAPYAIFPLSADDVVDVIMGFVDIAISLKLDVLEQALSRNDIAVRLARPQESETLFLEARRGEVGLILPPHLREQMMIELMTPDCLFEAIEYVLSLNEQRRSESRDQRVVVFEDEASAWDAGK